jgi:hypothetical protein
VSGGSEPVWTEPGRFIRAEERVSNEIAVLGDVQSVFRIEAIPAVRAHD